MTIVDTNYLVRLFTNRPKNLANQAIDDLRISEAKSVYLRDYVVSELVYVLEFHAELAYGRRRIAQGLRLILSHPAWVCDHKLHDAALTKYEATKFDYVDCLVIAESQLARATMVLT